MLLAPEAGEVSAALRGWLTAQGYGAVTDGAPPERLSGGIDFWVYGLRFAGPGLPPRWSAPPVARVPAAAARYDLLRQDSTVQSWVAARGYPAPEVLRVLAPGEALPSPVQVMARVSGVPLIAASSSPWGLLELLVRLAVADPVVCHGDLHPRNVLVAPGGSALHVIDWTNVGVGDRHGDIARTLLWFEIAAVAAPRRASRVLMRVLRRRLQRAYLNGYRRVLPVDCERVRLWRPVSLLAIWSAAEASQRGFFGSQPRLPASLIGWAARELRCAEPGIG